MALRDVITNWLLWSTLFLSFSTGILGIPIATFHGDQKSDLTTFSSPPLPSASVVPSASVNKDHLNLTLCFRFTLDHLHSRKKERSRLFTLSMMKLKIDAVITRQASNMFLEICQETRDVTSCIKTDITKTFAFSSWIHSCTTFAPLHLGKRMKSYIDGALENSVIIKVEREDQAQTAVNSNGNILVVKQNKINKLQEMLHDCIQLSVAHSFSGSLTQVALWETLLDSSEVQGLANCSLDDLEGDMLAWNKISSNWNITIEEETLSSICKLNRNKFLFGNPLIFLEPISHNAIRSMCDTLGGKLPIPRDKDELMTLHNFIQTSIDSDNSITDDFRFNLGPVMSSNGTWTDPYTGEILTNWPQNVDKSENMLCAITNEGGSSVEQVDCDCGLASGVCLLDKRQKMFYMKGLPYKNDAFDTTFYIHGQVGRRPHFMGITDSHIFFNRVLDAWVLQSLKSPEVPGLLLRLPNSAIPIGRHQWESLAGDSIQAQHNGSHELTFSICGEGFFTCNSGLCIPLSQRCDTSVECNDTSDEHNCNYIDFGNNYIKEFLPFEGLESTSVFINVSILTVSNIDIVNNKFTADFFLHLRWKDPRLSFRDLSADTSMNYLRHSDLDRIWSPLLLFDNSLGLLYTTVDSISSGSVVREEEAVERVNQAENSNAYEAIVFSGRKNSIILQREYYYDYGCNFDLKFYPFDTQICTALFTVSDAAVPLMKLEKDGDGVKFLGERYLVEYVILYEALSISVSGNASQAQLKMVFRRRIEYHVYNTLLQTIILVFVGWMSYFFDEDNFTDRIMVTLTLMLVLTTLTSSIQASLPKTSYYKLIDCWLLFCLNMLVLTMAFHTFLAYTSVLAKETEDNDTVTENQPPITTREKRRKKKAQEEKVELVPRRFSDVIIKVMKEKAAGREEEEKGRVEAWKKKTSPSGGSVVVARCCLLRPKTLNRVGKIMYVLCIIIFNGVFFSVALPEYTRSPQDYLEQNN